MLEQHDFAADGDGVVGVVAGAVNQLADERVVDDVGADEVPAARFPNVDGAKVLGVAIIIVINIRLIVGRGVGGGDHDGAPVGTAELERLHFLQYRFELRELSPFSHGGLV